MNNNIRAKFGITQQGADQVHNSRHLTLTGYKSGAPIPRI